MTRFVLALITFFAAICAMAQTAPIAVQATLEKQLKGKIVTLRAFYPDQEVLFTPEGRYLGKKEPGPWTLWSRVKVRGISVTSDSVTIQGRRVYVFYDAKRRQFRNKDSEDKTWVTINFGTIPITLESTQTAFKNILVGNDENLSEFVPQEWQGFLKKEASAGAQSASPHQLTPEQADALKVSHSGITPPRAIYNPNTYYQAQARRSKLQGTVLLWAVVNEEGLVPAVRIARPLGMGLDENAIVAIRGWKFDPARKDGIPVKVEVNIEVHFELKSW